MIGKTKLSLQGVKQLLTRKKEKRFFVEVTIVDSGREFTEVSVWGVPIILPNEMIVEVEE